MSVGYTLKEIIGLGFSELYGITFKEMLYKRIDTQPDDNDIVRITVTIDHIIDRENLPNRMNKQIQMCYHWHDDVGETSQWRENDLAQLSDDN